MGTGDGRAVAARAAAQPCTLAIGLDANASAMADVSRRAARPAHKGGLPNALFAVAAAEAPPPELDGLADLVTVTLPWGSLLDAMLGRSMAAASGIASLVAPGGTVEALIATTARDGRDLPRLDEGLAPAIAAAWRPHDLRLETFRPATDREIASTASTWAKRLRLAPARGLRLAPANTSGRAGADGRAAWRIVLRRPA